MSTFLGDMIKKLRMTISLTQAEFSDIVGVTYVTISLWESGKGVPHLNSRKKIMELGRTHGVHFDTYMFYDAYYTTDLSATVNPHLHSSGYQDHIEAEKLRMAKQLARTEVRKERRQARLVEEQREKERQAAEEGRARAAAKEAAKEAEKKAGKTKKKKKTKKEKNPMLNDDDTINIAEVEKRLGFRLKDVKFEQE